MFSSFLKLSQSNLVFSNVVIFFPFPSIPAIAAKPPVFGGGRFPSMFPGEELTCASLLISFVTLEKDPSLPNRSFRFYDGKRNVIISFRCFETNTTPCFSREHKSISCLKLDMIKGGGTILLPMNEMMKDTFIYSTINIEG